MSRVAFKMKLKKGFEDEYKKRHDEIWPELLLLLREQGIYNYSIFFDKETNILFAVQDVDGTSGSQELGDNPIVIKWWNYMKDIMEVNNDNSPITFPLREVFHFNK